MTKIQCDLSGVPILDARFVIKVMDAITQARNTDSQAVSLDPDAGAKLLNLSFRFLGQFMGNRDARNDIMQGPDPAKEFCKKEPSVRLGNAAPEVSDHGRDAKVCRANRPFQG